MKQSIGRQPPFFYLGNMNPTELLTRILKSFYVGDPDQEQALQSLFDLQMWIKNGGSLPNVNRAIKAFEPTK